MFSGEGEYELCKKSVQNQTVACDQFFIENLPNKEAHELLYSTIMNCSDEFELFIKLDADMVFSSEDSVDEILKLYSKYPEVDHFCTQVHDWFTDRMMYGLHIFSNRVVWKKNNSALFLDPDPVIRGKKLVLKSYPAPLVYHVLMPTNEQSFYFGLHRGLKVVQHGERVFKFKSSFMQYRIMYRTFQRFNRTYDKRIALALLGFIQVLNCKFEGKDLNLSKASYNNLFDNFKYLKREEVKEMIVRELPGSALSWFISYLFKIYIPRTSIKG